MFYRGNKTAFARWKKSQLLELLAKKEEVLVNSFDFQKQELVKARGYDVRCTKEVTELVEVELENGETVRCTTGSLVSYTVWRDMWKPVI